MNRRSNTKAPVGRDERALVAACLSCDQDAIDALIAANRPAIVRLARAEDGSDDVDDICQDVYLRVFARLSTFEHRSRLSTWILPRRAERDPQPAAHRAPPPV